MRGVAAAAFMVLIVVFGLAVVAGLTVVAGFGATAFADPVLQQGRSAATCSRDVLVCEIHKDGKMIPTSECEAQAHLGIARYLYGDCYDED